MSVPKRAAQDKSKSLRCSVNEKSSINHNRSSTFVITSYILSQTKSTRRATPLSDAKSARSAPPSLQLSKGGTSLKRHRRGLICLNSQVTARSINLRAHPRASAAQSLHFCAHSLLTHSSADMLRLATTVPVAPSTTTRGGAIIASHSFCFLPVNDQQKAWGVSIFS